MTDLIEFLRARLDEDERIARAVEDPSWTIDHPHPGEPGWKRPRLLGKGLVESCDPATLTPAEGEHIARHDPARVLAEVDAKRRIIDLCGVEAMHDRVDALGEDVLRALALSYPDHPDYREEWRP